MKQQLYSGVSALSLLILPAVTLAQDADETQPFDLGELVVYGSKKEETFLRFPGTVVEQSGDALEKQNVRTLLDLEKGFSGVTVDQRSSRAYTNLSIRGAASLDFYNPLSQVYIDGVPQDAGMLGQVLPGGVESVEVLYGPQGTLYGRGAVGGVVNVVTTQPGEGETFSIRAEGGDLQKGVAVTAETLLGKGVWADIALGYNKEEDDLTRSAGGKTGGSEMKNGRVRLRFAPTDSPLNITLSAQSNEIDSEEEHMVSAANFDERTTSSPASEYTQKTNTFALNATYDLGWGTITSITSHQDRDLDRIIQGFATPETQTTTTQELRLNGSLGDSIDYVAGLYWQRTDFTRTAFGTLVAIETETKAAFANLTWQVSDRLSISPGLRYEFEESNADAEGFGVISNGSGDWSAFSPKLAANYEISDELSVFGVLSTGFKAGGFTRTATTNNVSFSYDPQKTYSAEVGLKYRSNDGRMTARLSGYYTLTEDYQMFVGSVPFQYLQNVGEVTSRGVEAQLAFEDNGWAWNVAAAYNNSEFTKYNNPLNPTTDLTGNTVPYAPGVTLAANIEKEFDLASGLGSLTPRLGVTYRSKTYFDEENAVSQDAYALVDAGLTWALDNGLEIDVYATNLFDEAYAVYGYQGFGGTEFQLGRGQEIGLVLNKSF